MRISDFILRKVFKIFANSSKRAKYNINGIKMAIFCKKIQNCSAAVGGFGPRPPQRSVVSVGFSDPRLFDAGKF